MQLGTVTQLLILLTLANGSPVIAKWILGDHFSFPFDGGIKFVDGRPIFGRSKTIRGVLISIFATMVGAPLIGLELKLGLIVGVSAMIGDLLSSFIKRRLDRPPSSRALGLDQIPESLVPLLVCKNILTLTSIDVVIGTAVFFAGELLISRLLFILHVREQPY
jgi:CDP-diglyceride synthetase